MSLLSTLERIHTENFEPPIDAVARCVSNSGYHDSDNVPGWFSECLNAVASCRECTFGMSSKIGEFSELLSDLQKNAGWDIVDTGEMMELRFPKYGFMIVVSLEYFDQEGNTAQARVRLL